MGCLDLLAKRISLEPEEEPEEEEVEGTDFDPSSSIRTKSKGGKLEEELETPPPT